MTTTTKASEAQESNPSNQSNPLSVLGEALDAASSSISDARSDATASAKAAALKVQSGVGTGAYYGAYGVSYGLVFSGVFLKELLPVSNSLRRGFEDGAGAAINSVARLQGREKVDTEALPDGVHTPAVQPPKPPTSPTVKPCPSAAS